MDQAESAGKMCSYELTIKAQTKLVFMI
jgi:hypothetical protein